jgi:hypothetical protein
VLFRLSRNSAGLPSIDAVAELVGIECGVVSG